MVKKPKKVKAKKEEKKPELGFEPDNPEMPVNKKDSVEEVNKEDIAAKAKRLSKGGLTTKEVGHELGINKYEASKLIKE